MCLEYREHRFQKPKMVRRILLVFICFPANPFSSIYYSLTKNKIQFISKLYLDFEQMSYVLILDES